MNQRRENQQLIVLQQLIDRIEPRALGRDLIRIGDPSDGGYLIPDDLTGIAGCFSPGVSTIMTFETMLAKRYGIPSYLAYFSVENAPVDNPYFDFEKKYLGIRDDISTMRLEEWFDKKAGIDTTPGYILQMDIERN